MRRYCYTESNALIAFLNFSTKKHIAHFQLKSEQANQLGQISTENLSQTSNREGSRATTALMCASLSPLL